MSEPTPEFTAYQERMRVKRMHNWLTNNTNHADHIAGKIGEIPQSPEIEEVLRLMKESTAKMREAGEILKRLNIDMMKAALEKADAEQLAREVDNA